MTLEFGIIIVIDIVEDVLRYIKIIKLVVRGN